MAWIFFRAPSVGTALDYLREMVTSIPLRPLRVATDALLAPLFMPSWEWAQREQQHGLEVARYSPWVRRTLYLAVIFLIVKFAGGQREFIYFQF